MSSGSVRRWDANWPRGSRRLRGRKGLDAGIQPKGRRQATPITGGTNGHHQIADKASRQDMAADAQSIFRALATASDVAWSAHRKNTASPWLEALNALWMEISAAKGDLTKASW